MLPRRIGYTEAVMEMASPNRPNWQITEEEAFISQQHGQSESSISSESNSAIIRRHLRSYIEPHTLPLYTATLSDSRESRSGNDASLCNYV